MPQRVNFDDLEPSEDYLLMFFDGKPFTGTACEEEKHLVSETEFREGQKSGVSRQWSERGALIREQAYLLGALHGEAKEWFPNRQIKQQGLYELGICVKEVEYDSKGCVIRSFELDANSPQFRTLQKLRTGSLAPCKQGETH
jgi:antitoxin component YwqK of YwqJK toxin-antitoxin module